MHGANMRTASDIKKDELSVIAAYYGPSAREKLIREESEVGRASATRSLCSKIAVILLKSRKANTKELDDQARTHAKDNK